MAQLDHLIFASADLSAGIDYIETLTGARAVFGGAHTGRGSHNALLTFNDTTYFEIIGVDDSQPKPPRPRPFGLDDNPQPHLAGYAIHPGPGETIEGLSDFMRARGHEPGTVENMHRNQPSGEKLSWRLTYLTDPQADRALAVPFVIDWGDSPSPALSLPSMGSIASLQVVHPDHRVRSLLGDLGLDVEVSDGPPSLAVTIQTDKGLVELM